MPTGVSYKNGYGLIIGVGADLPVTEQDATALHAIFVNPARAAYPQEQIHLLTGSRATRTDILNTFDVLREQVNSNPDATVITYFSGHGVRVEKSENVFEYFLVPYGYQAHSRASTAISSVEFTDKLMALHARKLIVLLDCCHANGVPALKGPEEVTIKSVPFPPDLAQQLGSGRGRVIITSSSEDEKSWTGRPYSVFTACLIEALEGRGAREKDGFAHIFDVVSYLLAQVPKRASGPQHPYVNRMDNVSEDFPLCYYAGGSKDIPGDSAPPPPTPRGRPADEQRFIEAEIASLRTTRGLYHERLTGIREAKALLPPDEVTRILRAESEMKRIQAEINQINSKVEELEGKLHG